MSKNHTEKSLKKRIALEAFRYYKKAETQKHRLRYLFRECTLRCPLECLHCGSGSQRQSGAADYIQGNIYKDRFLDRRHNGFEVMRNRSWTRTGKCAACEVYNYCEGNGLHLRDEKSGELLTCQNEMLK